MRRAATETRISAPWLDDPRLARLFAAIEREGDAAYVVGGAVRNTLLDLPAGDVDVATTALPEAVTARARAAGLKPVPTGIDHGTVTVVVEGHPFEVTTLRQDVASHGRHATVAFGRDWSVDAHRRDFTMNALYASLDGVVHDFVGGIADCRAGRVRFIGSAARRIEEDYLRILRFFRFHAAYGRGPLDAEGLAAAIAAREGLAGLSAERIGQETLKLMPAIGAPVTVAAMSDAGLLQRVLGRAADLGAFARLHALSNAGGRPARAAGEAVVFLTALAGWTEGDAIALGERLRLSNAARDRAVAATRAARAVEPGIDVNGFDRLAVATGRQGAGDAVVLAAARGRIDASEALRLLGAVEGRAVPVLPLGGRDVVALGVRPGPEVGRLVEAARAVWIGSGFTATGDDLVKFLKAEIVRIRANT